MTPRQVLAEGQPAEEGPGKSASSVPAPTVSTRLTAEASPEKTTSAETSRELSHQARAAKGRSLPGRVTGKIQIALEAMVFQGLSRAEAAAHAGMTDHGLRQSLRKSKTKRFYQDQLEILRTSFRAKNLHRLDSIADGTGHDNAMARVAAIKTMEQLADQGIEQIAKSSAPSPHFQIIVVQPPVSTPSQLMIDVTPEILE